MEIKKREIALSVIVPCYNVEPYLDRSLLSLSQQWNGRTDYEIILVNDASTDNTLSKLVSFKENYPNNVIVIDKPQNEGVTEARNSGLNVASGKWVVMFDPDDALAVGGYDYLLNKYADDNLDIISFGVKILPEAESPNNWEEPILYSENKPEVISSRYFLLRFHIGSSICFFYKKDIIKEIRYPVLYLLEDISFNLPIFLNEHKVKVVKDKIYYYLTRISSSTNTLNVDFLNRGCDDIVSAINLIDEYKSKEIDRNIYDELTRYQKKYVVNLFTRLLLSGKSKQEISDIYKYLKSIHLLPISRLGRKEIIINLLFHLPILMLLIRPLYRAYRKK